MHSDAERQRPHSDTDQRKEDCIDCVSHGDFFRQQTGDGEGERHDDDAETGLHDSRTAAQTLQSGHYPRRLGRGMSAFTGVLR
jgi:hypothetical protein